MRTKVLPLTALIFALSSGSALAQDSELEIGERIFIDKCEYCHGDGVQKGGTHTLGARYQGAIPAVLSERTNLTGEYIRAVVRTWTNGMAPFRPSEITDSELDALIAYLTRNNE